MCGTMMPTKPISPLTETAAAVPSVAATTTIRRSRRDVDAELAASSSPTREHVEHPPVQQHQDRATTSRADERDVGPARGREPPRSQR